MREVHKKYAKSNFAPNYFAQSIEMVDFSVLKKRGVRFVALDADHTLVRFRGRKIKASTRLYLLDQKVYIDGWCIASNRITNDLGELSSSIKAPIVRSNMIIRKPKRRYFNRVINHFQAEPHEIAMIGDKLLADVWGANRMGMVTVLVNPFGGDGIHDRAIGTRRWERFMTRRYRKKDDLKL